MPAGNILGVMGLRSRGVRSGLNLSQNVLMSSELTLRAYRVLTVLSVELLIRATLSRSVSSLVVVLEFSSYISMGEGSGYLSRGVCFWSPFWASCCLGDRNPSDTPLVSSRDEFRESRDEFREF